MEYIYVVISKTPSKFAKVIRKTMGVEYNHASLALDENLRQIYAFARYKNQIPVAAGLVKEHPSRFTLCKDEDVKIKIFKVPVSYMQYADICRSIIEIMNDREYQYNLFSALTYPVFRGFETYKAYTCVEFVMNMLLEAGIELHKPTWSYQPQELVELLHEYEIYTGRLLDYRDFVQDPNHEFFKREKRFLAWKVTIIVLATLLYRDLCGFCSNLFHYI